MNRQQMLSILNAASDENLIQAMSAIGVEAQPDDGMGMGLGDESAQGLESWNAKQVTMGDPQKPAFLDKSQFAPVQQKPQPRPEYYNAMQDMDGVQQFIPQEELLGGGQG